MARIFNDLGVLHTLCDASESTLAGCGEGYLAVRKTRNLDEPLKDLVIRKVAITAPAVLHYKLAKADLLAGKDVFVEKPLCLDVSEG